MNDRSIDWRKARDERRNLRTAAESQLAENHAGQAPATVPVENLMHELQVHQIEPEMQHDELQRTHLALEESSDRYLDLFEFAPVGYLALTAAGLIAEVNFSAATLLGVERKKLLLCPLSRYIAREFVNFFHLNLSGLSHQHEQQSYDMQIRREDGELRDVHVDALRVPAEKREITWLITLTDITERIQAEKALSHSRSIMKLLVRTISDPIWVKDANGVYLTCNPSVERLLGAKEAEIVGKTDYDFFDKELADSFREHDQLAMDKMGPQVNEEWVTFADGGQRTLLETTKTPMLDEQGVLIGVVGIGHDITQRRQAEQVLLDARRHLEKQVQKTVVELNHLKEETEEVSTALKVMIKLRGTESSDAKSMLILELKQEVMPFLHSLKNGSRDPRQVRLLSTLEANLQRLVSSYGSAASMTSVYKHLTPKQIQVASMVREGFSTKAIASALSLSPETVSIHRKNIRKKLGLDSKADNLRSYLITLDK